MRSLVPEPTGRRPAAFGASGDVWQRGRDRLWRTVEHTTGRTWFEIEHLDGPLWPIPEPPAAWAAPYTDELPTIDFAAPRLVTT